MENEQITLNNIYEELRNLKEVLKSKGIISQLELSENKEAICGWFDKIQFLADEKLLAEDWLSPEDEEAWKDL